MGLVEVPSGECAPEVAWRRCEAAAIAAVGAANAAVVAMVEIIAELIDSDGWVGSGIRSPEHWVMWKMCVSRHRAEGLTAIARRRGELPRCWALFRQGRLTEDAMTRIARRTPAGHDAQVAALAPILLISQLTRVLAALPPLADDEGPPADTADRVVRLHTAADGSGRGEWALPAEEHALVVAALTAARDAEFRDRNDLDHTAAVRDADGRRCPGSTGSCAWPTRGPTPSTRRSSGPGTGANGPRSSCTTTSRLFSWN
jgi:hypothetical protein